MAVELRRKGSGDYNISQANIQKRGHFDIFEGFWNFFGLYWCLDVIVANLEVFCRRKQFTFQWVGLVIM